MWKLISIYFGCTFITCTFCDTEIYLLNYLCKADTEVTEKKIKLDILRSCLSFKAVNGCTSKYLQGDFWLILSVSNESVGVSSVCVLWSNPSRASAPLKLLLDIQVKSLKLMDYKLFKTVILASSNISNDSHRHIFQCFTEPPLSPAVTVKFLSSLWWVCSFLLS